MKPNQQEAGKWKVGTGIFHNSLLDEKGEIILSLDPNKPLDKRLILISKAPEMLALLQKALDALTIYEASTAEKVAQEVRVEIDTLLKSIS